MKLIVALGDVIFSIDYLAVAKIAGAQEILRSGFGFPLSAHRSRIEAQGRTYWREMSRCVLSLAVVPAMHPTHGRRKVK